MIDYKHAGWLFCDTSSEGSPGTGFYYQRVNDVAAIAITAIGTTGQTATDLEECVYPPTSDTVYVMVTVYAYMDKLPEEPEAWADPSMEFVFRADQIIDHTDDLRNMVAGAMTLPALRNVLSKLWPHTTKNH